jgi:hypothetical protein
MWHVSEVQCPAELAYHLFCVLPTPKCTASLVQVVDMCKEVTTPVESHWRKSRLRGVRMSSMLDYHTPHLSLPARRQTGVLSACVCCRVKCRFAWRQLPAADFSLKSYISRPGSSSNSRGWLGLARPRTASAAATAAERAAVMKSAGRTGS